MKVKNSKSIFTIRQKSFSLSELMIVIGTIGIMTAVGLVSLNNHKTTRALENASREVAAAVREAQNKALTGKKSQTQANIISCGHGFYAVSNGTNYLVYDNYTTNLGSCSVVSGNYDSSSSNVSSSYSLKNGVTFGSVNNIDIYFTSPHASASITTTTTITLTKGSTSHYVCVYPDGNVIENGANSSCPSP